MAKLTDSQKNEITRLKGDMVKWRGEIATLRNKIADTKARYNERIRYEKEQLGKATSTSAKAERRRNIVANTKSRDSEVASIQNSVKSKQNEIERAQKRVKSISG